MVIFISSFIGLFTFYANTDEGVMLMKTAIAGPARALFFVNNIITNGYMKGITGELNQREKAQKHDKNKNDKKGLGELFLFLISPLASL